MAKVTKNNLEYPYNALVVILNLPEDSSIDDIKNMLFPANLIDKEFGETLSLDEVFNSILGKDLYELFLARYKDQKTYKEISEEYGKSREVNRQKLLKAISKLHDGIFAELNTIYSEYERMKYYETKEEAKSEPEVKFVEEVKVPEEKECVSEMEVATTDAPKTSTNTSVTYSSGDDTDDTSDPESHICAYKKRGIFGLLRKIFKH